MIFVRIATMDDIKYINELITETPATTGGIGITVMKMSSRSGFQPQDFTEISYNEQFLEGCKNCPNYNILEPKKKCNCLCTAMLFDPEVNLNYDVPEQADTQHRYRL